ncbi:Auxin-induced protein [Thalictrum thalictroides]|uniref:Auxin-induced protein n=1 Tax=Thalictrum thalictroides TaxID=46969 RepID=A0A7J6V5L2_THATH|nr:Auxin-induced protein [Thalictrum thalictroides]
MSSLLKKILCCGMKSFPSDLPEGHVRVYVGKDVPCKFELEANYLNHPLFEDLLELSVDEYGYSYNGALRIACEIDLFQYLLELLRSRNPQAHYMELQDLISKFYASNGGVQKASAQF